MERGPVLACVKALRAASTRRWAGFGLDSGCAPGPSCTCRRRSPCRLRDPTRDHGRAAIEHRMLLRRIKESTCAWLRPRHDRDCARVTVRIDSDHAAVRSANTIDFRRSHSVTSPSNLCARIACRYPRATVAGTGVDQRRGRSRPRRCHRGRQPGGAVAPLSAPLSALCWPRHSCGGEKRRATGAPA